MNQALSIWSELWQAYYSDNSYGSDTAEIYAYRLMAHNPSLHMPESSQSYKVASHEAAELAAQSMRNIVFMFCKEADCKCVIDGEDCDTWLAHNPEFDHRCHVYVMPRKGDKNER